MIRAIFRRFFPLKQSGATRSDLFVVGERPDLLKISENVYLGGKVTVFCNAPVEIGDHTMIAIHTVIHTATHDYSDHPAWSKRIDKPVKIGSHVWIGANATILPGVIIEDYAVIGAGCVVAKNVPKGAVVVGNPARILRKRNLDMFLQMKIDDPKKAIIVKGDYLNKYYQ